MLLARRAGADWRGRMTFLRDMDFLQPKTPQPNTFPKSRSTSAGPWRRTARRRRCSAPAAGAQLPRHAARPLTRPALRRRPVPRAHSRGRRWPSPDPAATGRSRSACGRAERLRVCPRSPHGRHGGRRDPRKPPPASLGQPQAGIPTRPWPRLVPPALPCGHPNILRSLRNTLLTDLFVSPAARLAPPRLSDPSQ